MGPDRQRGGGDAGLNGTAPADLVETLFPAAELRRRGVESVALRVPKAHAPAQLNSYSRT